MNQKYFKLLPLFLFLVILSQATVAQSTLSSTDQALRYSIYARLGQKIIPIKLSETAFKLQFVVEKIEEKTVFLQEINLLTLWLSVNSKSPHCIGFQ